MKGLIQVGNRIINCNQIAYAKRAEGGGVSVCLTVGEKEKPVLLIFRDEQAENLWTYLQAEAQLVAE